MASGFEIVFFALIFATPIETTSHAPDRIAMDPLERIVLGDVDRIAVTIRAPDTGETLERPLRLSVNVGRFERVERVGPGVYRSHYVPPATRHPQVALVAVWRELGTDAPVRFIRIPLFARTNLPIRTKAGSEVRVLVGSDEFGPVIADGFGSATVPIVVPPDLSEVIATSRTGATSSQARVATAVPPYNRLTVAVTPHRVPADGKSAAMLHVYRDARDAIPIERIAIDAPYGTTTPVDRSGHHYRFRYVPERNTIERDVEVVARVDGDAISKGTVILSLGMPIAEHRIVVRACAGLVADGAATCAMRVRIADRLGLAISGLSLSSTISSGRVVETRDLGEGDYEIVVSAPETHPDDGFIRLALGVRNGPEFEAIAIPIAREPLPSRDFATLGARAGASYVAAAVALGVGAELAFYTPWLHERLAVFASFGARRLTQTFDARNVLGRELVPSSSLEWISIGVGATFDIAWIGLLRIYPTGSVLCVPYSYATSIDALHEVKRGIALGFDAGVGAEFHAFFAELTGSFTAFPGPALEDARALGSLAIGYRIGVAK